MAADIEPGMDVAAVGMPGNLRADHAEINLQPGTLSLEEVSRRPLTISASDVPSQFSTRFAPLCTLLYIIIP
jgi:hypothetical protein